MPISSDETREVDYFSKDHYNLGMKNSNPCDFYHDYDSRCRCPSVRPGRLANIVRHNHDLDRSLVAAAGCS